MTLSPDETQLYVTNGNLNCVAVIALGGTNSGDQVVGLIPTGWYPNSVSLSWFPNTRPSPARHGEYVRGQWEVPDGSESRLVLWRLRAWAAGEKLHDSK